MRWDVLVVAEPGDESRTLVDELTGVERRLRCHVVAGVDETASAAARLQPILALVRLPGSPDRLLKAVRILHEEVPEATVVAEVPADHPLVAVQAFSLGAADCLKQPVAPWEWQHRIRGHLDRHRQHRLLERLAERSRHHSGERGRPDRTLEVLARIDASRDGPTNAHQRRTARLTGLLAEALSVPPVERQRLEAGAALHDIGKIGIPEAVLRKPGRYNDAERWLMHEHPRIGYEILAAGDQPHLRTGATIALTHHERIDGRGYPDGLAGQEIPMESRMVAVADAFDAITARRAYKGPESVETAMAELEAGAGSQFDPECVRAFASRRTEVGRLLAGA